MTFFRSRLGAFASLPALAVLAFTGCGGSSSGTSGSNYSTFAAKNYVYAGTFGGTLISSFVAVDSRNNVYLTEVKPASTAKAVQKFQSDGTLLAQFGTSGNGNGQFGAYGPYGLTVDKTGAILVADNFNHRIEKFSSDGTFLSQFDTKNILPNYVAVDTQGNVYVSGFPFILTTGMNGSPFPLITGLALLYKFRSDGMGQTQVNTQAQSTQQSVASRGVAISEDGTVYVADAENSQILMFKPDGTLASQFGLSGSGNGQTSSPEGIALDGAGNVYVADSGNKRIEKFKSDGTYLAQFPTTAGGTKTTPFVPQSVAVDGNGTVYVCDGQNPVEVFHPTP